jgi:hypothetical protein
VLLFQASRDGRAREAVHHMAAFCTPVVLAWAAMLGYFWIDDRLGIFVTTVILFNRDYAGSLSSNLVRALSPSRLWPDVLGVEVPLLVLAGVGLALGLGRARRAVLALLSYFVGAAVMVALPGHWWPYYYQVYVPPLVLGATFGLAEVERLRPPWGRRVRAVLTIGVVGLGLFAHLGQLTLDGDAASLHKHGRIFIAVRETARRVSDLLRDGEAVYVYGIDPGIYFHSRRRPIAQALWINHLTGPLRVPLRHTLRRQLREVRPELIVLDTRYRLDWIPPGLVLWVEQEYERLPAVADLAPFQLLVRRDSALRARALAEPTSPARPGTR